MTFTLVLIVVNSIVTLGKDGVKLGFCVSNRTLAVLQHSRKLKTDLDATTFQPRTEKKKMTFLNMSPGAHGLACPPNAKDANQQACQKHGTCWLEGQ